MHFIWIIFAILFFPRQFVIFTVYIFFLFFIFICFYLVLFLHSMHFILIILVILFFPMHILIFFFLSSVLTVLGTQEFHLVLPLSLISAEFSYFRNSLFLKRSRSEFR